MKLSLFVAVSVLMIWRVSSTDHASISQVYRTTKTGWSIPGGAEASPVLNMSKEEVRQWEGLHADVAFGGPSSNYFNITCEPGVTPNEAMYPADGLPCKTGIRIGQTGYMYNQVLDLTPYDKEIMVKHLAGGDQGYEKLLLHYAVDTPYNLTGQKTEHGERTLINGMPWVAGWTRTDDHAGGPLYLPPPWKNTEVFKAATSGGALYVIMFERFASVNFSIEEQSRTTFNVVVEYISGCDELVDQFVPYTHEPHFYRVSKWNNVSITSDSTQGMTTSGVLRFNLPSDWKRCTTSDGTEAAYGGGQYFANKYIRDGVGAYMVRIRLSPKSGFVDPASEVVYPTLNDVRIARYIRYTDESNPNEHFRTIPGWNPANDRNGDGWVSDTEFASLVVPAATARFEYESRAIPLGRMWSTRSAWCRANAFLSNHSGSIFGKYLRGEWEAAGFLGAYNDDLLKLVGPDEFFLSRTSGSDPQIGMTNEYSSHAIDSGAIVVPYRYAFADMLATIANVTQSKWIMGNIANVNLLGNNDTLMFYKVIDAFLREDYITPWYGITGTGGVARLWDTFIYGAAGKVSLIQVVLREARAGHFNKSSEKLWNADVYTGTALYYFVNIPEITYYNAWGNGFNYGSANTFGGSNWWRSGIPMNIAYQPGGLLDSYIGVPDPDHRPEDPLLYQITIPKLTDYSIMGNSSSTLIQHQSLNYGLPTPIIPSHTYYAWRQARNWITKQPADAVLARKYTTGLVLFRTDTFGRSVSSFENADPKEVTVQLNGTFRQVFIDGSLGPNVTEVTLGMYDAAILETADARGAADQTTASPKNALSSPTDEADDDDASTVIIIAFASLAVAAIIVAGVTVFLCKRKGGEREEKSFVSQSQISVHLDSKVTETNSPNQPDADTVKHDVEMNDI